MIKYQLLEVTSHETFSYLSRSMVFIIFLLQATHICRDRPNFKFLFQPIQGVKDACLLYL